MSALSAGDGNGWVASTDGRKHWGRYGAAGLLVTSRGHALLQLRAGWTHNGQTWALPGGARDSHETAAQAALREATEETSLDVRRVHVVGEYVDHLGNWTYTTVLATADELLEVASTNPESDEMRWWPLEQVPDLPLHYGFAKSWPALRELLTEVP